MDSGRKEVTALELVQGQLAAYNTHDLETFCTYFSKDVSVIDGRTQEILFTGMEAFRKRYQTTFSNPKLHCHLLNRIEQDNIIIDHEEVSGITEEVVYAIAAYQIENGLIKQVTFY